MTQITTSFWWVRHAPVAHGGRIYGQTDLSCDCSETALFTGHCSSTLRGWIGNAGRSRAVLFFARGGRLFGITLLAVPILLAKADLPAAAQPAPATYSDAVQALAREQSAAEQYAVILDRFGKNDTTRYIQGITRYADAKADFDGLIEALKTDLIQGRDPGSSPKLAETLRAAAEKRVAFTSFVADQVVGDRGSAKGLLPDVVEVVPDLIRALTDAGIAICREYRAAGKEQRDSIRDELDHLKWKPFADLAKT